MLDFNKCWVSTNKHQISNLLFKKQNKIKCWTSINVGFNIKA